MIFLLRTSNFVFIPKAHVGRARQQEHRRKRWRKNTNGNWGGAI